MKGVPDIETSQNDEDFLGVIARKEFKELDKYKAVLVGKKIKEIYFAVDADEGLFVECEDGSGLYFAFADKMGIILALADTKELIPTLIRRSEIPEEELLYHGASG